MVAIKARANLKRNVTILNNYFTYGCLSSITLYLIINWLYLLGLSHYVFIKTLSWARSVAGYWFES